MTRITYICHRLEICSFLDCTIVGAVSTELDVRLCSETLYAGHEHGALTKERTFESLYVNLIFDV